MKKVLILVLILVFTGAVLSRNAFAAEEYVVEETSYQLPYPGTLSDSPIYFIKDLRDKLVGSLILDSSNKAFYYLFLSDKRLWGGWILAENGKENLASDTLLESEKYFEKAVSEAEKTEKQGRNTSELKAKLLVSSSKHNQILEDASSMMAGDDLDKVSQALSLNQNLRNRVIRLPAGR